MQTEPKISPFVMAYLECAIWTADEDIPDGMTVYDFTPAAVLQATGDCEAFQKANAELLEASELSENSQGHDFWLTRNGHGAGFWDRDLPDGLGDALSDACKAFGESYVTEADGVLALY